MVYGIRLKTRHINYEYAYIFTDYWLSSGTVCTAIKLPNLQIFLAQPAMRCRRWLLWESHCHSGIALIFRILISIRMHAQQWPHVQMCVHTTYSSCYWAQKIFTYLELHRITPEAVGKHTRYSGRSVVGNWKLLYSSTSWFNARDSSCVSIYCIQQSRFCISLRTQLKCA